MAASRGVMSRIFRGVHLASLRSLFPRLAQSQCLRPSAQNRSLFTPASSMFSSSSSSSSSRPIQQQQTSPPKSKQDPKASEEDEDEDEEEEGPEYIPKRKAKNPMMKIGYAWMIGLPTGILTFVLAKRQVDKNRLKQLKVRQRMRQSNEGEFEGSRYQRHTGS